MVASGAIRQTIEWKGVGAELLAAGTDGAFVWWERGTPISHYKTLSWRRSHCDQTTYASNEKLSNESDLMQTRKIDDSLREQLYVDRVCKAFGIHCDEGRAVHRARSNHAVEKRHGQQQLNDLPFLTTRNSASPPAIKW